jgi:CheY-like chemotaxis protein
VSAVEAPTGVAAFKVWQQYKERIDLLLTDIVMPEGMTGRELAEQLRQEHPRLKVIFTSGYSADVMGKGEALREGVNFVQKPYRPTHLLQTVRDRLDAAS